MGCASSACGALGRGGSANPIQQCYQVGAVLICYCGELQPQAAAWDHMPHDRFGPDWSFWNKKIKPGLRAQGPGNWRREEQSPYAQIANARNIFDSLASPADPHCLGGFHARNQSPRIERSCASGCHNSPLACGIERVEEGATTPLKAVADHNWAAENKQSGEYLKARCRIYLSVGRAHLRADFLIFNRMHRFIVTHLLQPPLCNNREEMKLAAEAFLVNN